MRELRLCWSRFAKSTRCLRFVRRWSIARGLWLSGRRGVRKINDTTPVTVNDLWHLGSDTKAMTATLIGRLVEQREIRWESTLAEIFPELASSMRDEMKAVTVKQLLSHRAGLTANYNWQALSREGTLQEQRYAVVKKAVTEKTGICTGGCIPLFQHGVCGGRGGGGEDYGKAMGRADKDALV